MVKIHVLLPFISAISHVYGHFYLDVKELETESYEFSILRTPALISNNDRLVDNTDSSYTFSDLPFNFVEKHYEHHVVVGNRLGKLFYCGLPKKVNKTLEALIGKEKRRNLLNSINESEIEMTLSRHLRNCIKFYNAGWWTYEYCFTLNAAYQFHMDERAKAPPEQKIDLGHVLDPEKIWNKTEQETLFVERNKPLYFSKFYSLGAACSEGSKFRRTEVRFYCDKTAWGVELKSVEEPETCSYIFHVHVKALCNVDGFEPPESKPTDNDIICLPALNEPDMKEYKERDRKKREMAAKEATAVKSKVKKPILTPKIVTLEDSISTLVDDPSRFLHTFELAIDRLFSQATRVESKMSKPRTFKTYIDDLMQESKRKKNDVKDSDSKLTKAARTLAKLINSLDREIEISDTLVGLTSKEHGGENTELENEKSAAQLVEDELADKAGDKSEASADTGDTQVIEQTADRSELEPSEEDQTGSLESSAVGNKQPKAQVTDSSEMKGEVKIQMTTAYYDERTKKIVKVSSPSVFSMQKFVAMLTGSDERSKEQRRHTDLQNSYHFDFEEDEDE